MASLWRYPVKSMQGEEVDSAVVGERGIEGDRQWGVVDLDTGLVLTGRREPKLLFGTSRVVGDSVVVALPDGSVAPDDDSLSDWLGRRVGLRRVDRSGRGRFEIALAPVGQEDDGGAAWFEWDGPVGSFHDSAAVSIVTTGTLGAWDARRFRPNVVLDGDAGEEDRLVGSKVTIGTATFDVVRPIDRCVMVTRAQPGGLERDLDVLRTINAERATVLAVGGEVIREGRIGVGDDVVRA